MLCIHASQGADERPEKVLIIGTNLLLRVGPVRQQGIADVIKSVAKAVHQDLLAQPIDIAQRAEQAWDNHQRLSLRIHARFKIQPGRPMWLSNQ
ncbi:hypothetical protein XhyaCFBP1156_16120 [Xanthomonas hyacinthi]|uniref:Uncharacterized protein n=1 Tax=Xanthomonas hyacinthi TaxID=56455 RepID=A0A2S7ESM7_9XANT|nr:hypothetical protein XhyaCFBP1156_16120 [Xanthomonas hyacinthi]